MRRLLFDLGTGASKSSGKLSEARRKGASIGSEGGAGADDAATILDEDSATPADDSAAGVVISKIELSWLFAERDREIGGSTPGVELMLLEAAC